MKLTSAYQYVEPAVSVAKFNREIEEFHAYETEYRKRGWFLIKATYPSVVVLFGAAKLNPPAIVGAFAFDYTNYDAEPPSVRVVNPFSLEPYLGKNLPKHLLMLRAMPGQEMPNGDNVLIQLIQQQALVQSHSPEDVPFVCLPGVREYHQHPGHTGDAWEIHRPSGAGRLVRLLEVFDKYITQQVVGYSVNLVPQVGLQVAPPPQ